jgi:hypothetical protein
MGKTKVFMAITAIISVLCFNFNKLLNYILTMVSDNMYDESVLVYGPCIKSKPIVVLNALIDGKVFTNKTDLLLNWKWDFDISGITLSDILILKHDASIMLIHYNNKNVNDGTQYSIQIDILNNTLTKKHMLGDIPQIEFVKILFGEVKLF